MSKVSKEPKIRYEKPEEKDPWGMNREPKAGRKVISRAIKFPDRER